MEVQSSSKWTVNKVIVNLGFSFVCVKRKNNIDGIQVSRAQVAWKQEVGRSCLFFPCRLSIPERQKTMTQTSIPRIKINL
jgi:hypothetical protein